MYFVLSKSSYISMTVCTNDVCITSCYVDVPAVHICTEGIISQLLSRKDSFDPFTKKLPPYENSCTRSILFLSLTHCIDFKVWKLLQTSPVKSA